MIWSIFDRREVYFSNHFVSSAIIYIGDLISGSTTQQRVNMGSTRSFKGTKVSRIGDKLFKTGVSLAANAITTSRSFFIG